MEHIKAYGRTWYAPEGDEMPNFKDKNDELWFLLLLEEGELYYDYRVGNLVLVDSTGKVWITSQCEKENLEREEALQKELHSWRDCNQGVDDRIEGYIKAVTSYGGDEHYMFERYFTEENKVLFEEWLKSQTKVQGVTLYRGYTFERGYWEDGSYGLGDTITVDAMTAEAELPSFTLSPLRAVKYINDYGNGLGLSDNVRVLFVIQTSGKHFVDLTKWSFYPEEGEHKCERETQLKIVGLRDTGGYLEIKCEEVWKGTSL